MPKAVITDVLERFVAESALLDKVLWLSVGGIRQASNAVKVEEALANYDALDEEILGPRDISRQQKRARNLEAARAQAAFAQTEIDAGFPVVHGQAAVARWGLLEATIEDIVVCVLLNEPELRSNEQMRRIRVPLAEFYSLDDEDRMRLLVREYARSTSADLKAGVSRFETLLEPIGMSGAVDEPLRRDLFELSQVRNVLVHRAGIADRKFCDACPWLGLKPVDRIQVTHSRYRIYGWAITEYFNDILVRDLVRRGAPPEKAAARIGEHRSKRPELSPSDAA